MNSDCIFCKIVNGNVPATKIYENKEMIVFNDIHPLAPIHFLIVPKMHIESLVSCNTDHINLLGEMLLLAPKLANERGLTGFKTSINTGKEGGQEVLHLHMHVYGGGKLPNPG